MSKTRVPVFFLALLVSILAAECAMAATDVTISAAPDNTAALACRQALHDKASLAGIPDLRLHDIDPNDFSFRGAAFSISLTASGGANSNLLTVPMAFRDAAHFQNFLTSDLYRDLRKSDRQDLFAVAYGGFYQLFSGARAMTEPAHFATRFIGGAPHTLLYDSFGAFWNVLGRSYQDDISLMGDAAIAAVDMPLIEASRYNIKSKARYLNLTFTALNAVFMHNDFKRKLDEGVYNRVVVWAEAAARSCSATNLQTEQAELAKLKAANVTIVPVDRAAFIKAAWSYGFGRIFTYWSVKDFDRLEALDTAGPKQPTPSDVLASLPNKIRDPFIAMNRRNEQEGVAQIKTKGVREKLQNAWLNGLSKVVNKLAEALPPDLPKKDDDEDLGWHANAAVSSDREAQTILADANRQKGTFDQSLCKPDCHLTIPKWIGAARYYAKAGNGVAAKTILRVAEQMTETKVVTGFVLDKSEPPPAPTAYSGSRDDRIMVLRVYSDMKDPEIQKSLQRARSLFPVQPSAFSAPAFDDDAEPIGNVNFDLVDRIGYLTEIAKIATRNGDKPDASSALAEAASLASDSRSIDLLKVATTYWVLGDQGATWAFVQQALSKAEEPSQLLDVINAFPALTPLIGADSASVIGEVADLTRPFGVVQNQGVFLGGSKAVPGWGGDWVDYTLYAGALAKSAGDTQQLARLRGIITSARRDRAVAKKLAGVYPSQLEWLK